MAYSANDRSERLLQGRRFTTNAQTLGQEAFTDVFDLGAGEIYTDDGLIPTGSSQLPFSGSLQSGLIVSASTVDPTLTGADDLPILKYHYRHALKGASNGNRLVYYFTTSEPSSHDDYVGSEGIIEADQETNFVSPKYVDPQLSPSHADRTTEDEETGYKVVVRSGADAASATVINTTDYVWDFKTGILSFVGSAPHGATDFVYISVYQYVGRTLRSQIDDGSIGGGGNAASISGSLGPNADLIRSLTAASISGSTRFEISGSDDGFVVNQDSSIKFVSGTAGVTVVSDGSDTITIGDKGDSVTFQDIILSGSANNVTVLESRQNLVMRAGEDGNSETRIETSQLVLQNEAINGFPKLLFLNTDSSVGSNQETARIELGENDDFDGITRTAGATISTVSREAHDSTTGGTKIVFSAVAATSSSLRHILELDSGEGYEDNFTVSGSIRALSGSNFVGNLIGTADSASVIAVTDDASTDQNFGIVFATTTGSGTELKSHEEDFSYNPGLNGGTLTLKSAGAQQLNITTTAIQPTVNGNFNLVTTSANSILRMGNADNTVQILGSASIAGDLIVQGSTTSINTTNLNVEDQFLLVNSGSATLKDGGIIVSSGVDNSGSAFYYDADSNRWALTGKNTTNWDTLSETPKQYVVSVSASAVAPSSTPLDFGDSNEYYGMMHVNTENGDIYIYS